MTFFFTGDKNYLKRSPATGSTTITGPDTLTAWLNYESSHTVNHNLGYIPQVRVYYDPYNDGKVFYGTGDRTSLFEPYANNMSCSWLVTTTSLTIYLDATTNMGGTVPIYWVIYLDNAS